MARNVLMKELPFLNLTNYAVANIFATDKSSLQHILKESGISRIIRRQLNPIQMDCFDDINCDYYDESEFNRIIHGNNYDVSFFHQNIRSLPKHAGSLIAYLQCINLQFDVIVLSEIGKKNIPMMKYVFKDYTFLFRTPPNNPKGGVAALIKTSLGNVNIRDDLELKSQCDCKECQIESIFFDINLVERHTVGCIYRHPNGNINHFSDALHESLRKINKGTPVVICGDLNIDLIKSWHPKIKQYLDGLFELQLIPLITLPTRIPDDTQTLIDHIYMRSSKRSIRKTIKSGILYSSITDHLPTFMLLSDSKSLHNHKRYIRIYNDHNIAGFKIELQSTNWEHVLESTDTNVAYGLFISKFQEAFNHNFPLVQQSRARQRDKKWITKDLRLSIQHKNLLLKRKLNNPSDTNKRKFSKYNNVLQKRLASAENQYYLDILNNKYTSNFKFWKTFGSVLNPSKQKKQTRITKIIFDNKEYSEPKDISNAFNNYFSTIGQKLNSNFPNDNSDFKRYMKYNSVHSIYMHPVDRCEVINEISKLDKNKSSGPDDIPPKVIKHASEHIAEVLTHIYNTSITQGVYPDLLKISEVIALYKKGTKFVPDNYRPISLLDVFDKIYEKLIYKRMVVFLNKHNMLFQFQFGFREGHSTTLALTEIIDNIKKSIDNNQYTIGIFLDLCKAFDTVDHSILLQKLKYYGIRGNAHSLLSS